MQMRKMILPSLVALTSVLASTTWSDVILKASAAKRDAAWKTENWSKGAYVIHGKGTIYKVTTAKMTWSFPQTGKFGLKLNVLAKSNGSAPIWVKVNGKEVWKGETPLPYGLSRAYCCGSSNDRDCHLNKGVGELETIDAKTSLNLNKGDVIEFWGKTAYHCGPLKAGHGGGTYAGIVELQLIGSGTGGGNPEPKPTPPKPPVLSLSTDKVSFEATEGGSDPKASSINAGNKGEGTLPGLTAGSSEPWLKSTVKGSGNGQTIENQATVKGLKAGTHTATVSVSGKDLGTVKYTVTLKVKGTPTGIRSFLSRRINHETSQPAEQSRDLDGRKREASHADRLLTP